MSEASRAWVEVVPSRRRATLLRLGAGLSVLLAVGLAPAAFAGSLPMTVLIAALAGAVVGLGREANRIPELVALRCTKDGRAQALMRVPGTRAAMVVTGTGGGRPGTDFKVALAGVALPLNLQALHITAGLIVLAAPGVRTTLWCDMVPASFYRHLAACGRWSARRPAVARPTAP